MASPDDIYKGGSSLLIRGVLFEGENTDIYISEEGFQGRKETPTRVTAIHDPARES